MLANKTRCVKTPSCSSLSYSCCVYVLFAVSFHSYSFRLPWAQAMCCVYGGEHVRWKWITKSDRFWTTNGKHRILNTVNVVDKQLFFIRKVHRLNCYLHLHSTYYVHLDFIAGKLVLFVTFELPSLIDKYPTNHSPNEIRLNDFRLTCCTA